MGQEQKEQREEQAYFCYRHRHLTFRILHETSTFVFHLQAFKSFDWGCGGGAVDCPWGSGEWSIHLGPLVGADILLCPVLRYFIKDPSQGGAFVAVIVDLLIERVNFGRLGKRVQVMLCHHAQQLVLNSRQNG